MMQMPTDNALYRLMDWMVKLAYLNLLWIFFTCLGAVFLGWVPATKAMYSILRRWTRKQETFNVAASFWKEYKKEWSSDILASFLFLILGMLLAIDLKFFLAGYSAMHTLGKLFTIQLITVAIVLGMNYVSSSYPDEWSLLQKLKDGLIRGATSPFKTLLVIMTSILSILLLFLIHPGLVVLFGGSLLALLNLVLYDVLNLKSETFCQGTSS